MPVDRKPIFQAVRHLLKKHQPAWITYTPEEVALLDKAIDEALAVPAVPPSTPPVARQVYKLSQRSKDEMKPLHPTLRAVIELAITYTLVDFRVNQVERSLDEQKKAVATGNSRTMKSKHLKRPDGWVWAADLVALINGTVSWAIENYAAIAWAMDKAATELKVAGHIRWGCAWDRVLSDFGGDPKSYMAEVKAYAARHPGKDLIDGPHFEWVE